MERLSSSLVPEIPVFSRQPTSPFDVMEDGTLKDGSSFWANMKILGGEKVELTLPNLKIVLNTSVSSTILFINGGGIEGAMVGERLEVASWFLDESQVPQGMLVHFDGKPCFSTQQIHNINPKVVKAAKRFLEAISKFAGTSAFALLDTMGRFSSEHDKFRIWRTHMLARCLDDNFLFESPITKIFV